MNEVPNEFSLSEPLPTWRDPRGLVRRRPLLALIIALILIAIVMAIVWIIHHGANSTPAGQRRAGMNVPMAVAVATASTGAIELKLPALGTVTPLATVTVQSQISGQLQTIGFKEGQLVRAGDFLAQIDPRPYQAALEQAEGNLKRDQALLADASLDEKRYETLVAEDSIASQTLDTQKALVKQDEGTVAADEAAVATAKVNLAYCHIVSPVTGRVGLRQVDQGNYITPALANGIVVVTQLSPMSIIFTIPEDSLPQIQRRVASGATLTVEAWDKPTPPRSPTASSRRWITRLTQRPARSSCARCSTTRTVRCSPTSSSISSCWSTRCRTRSSSRSPPSSTVRPTA
jgi:multidrug efflux system membrane fusion protein